MTEVVVGLQRLNGNFEKGERLLLLFAGTVPDAWLGQQLQASSCEDKRKTKSKRKEQMPTWKRVERGRERERQSR